MAGLLFPPKSAAAKATAASVPVCPAAAFSVERIEDPAQLAGLEPVWNRLLDESDVLHPFVTHEWVQTWWECYAGLARLSVLVAREGNTVRAIAPLMRARQSMLGLPVDCTLAARNDHSPRFDLIVAGRAAEAYRALWSTMAPSAGLKALEIGDVPADSATVAALVTMARRDGLLCGLRTTAESPCVEISGSWDEYYAARSRRHRDNVRTRMRKLQREGFVDLEVVDGGPALSQALCDGFALEGAAWKRAEGTAIVCRPDLVTFYTRLAERSAARGWLRLLFLTVGGRRVAFAYALLYRGRMFVLKTGYHPDYGAHSPGHLLFSLALREAFAQGLTRFDFLGARDRWKLEWTEHTRPHLWITVLPNNAAGHLMHAARFKALPRMRRSSLYRGSRDAVLGARASVSSALDGLIGRHPSARGTLPHA